MSGCSFTLIFGWYGQRARGARECEWIMSDNEHLLWVDELRTRWIRAMLMMRKFARCTIIESIPDAAAISGNGVIKCYSNILRFSWNFRARWEQWFPRRRLIVKFEYKIAIYNVYTLRVTLIAAYNDNIYCNFALLGSCALVLHISHLKLHCRFARRFFSSLYIFLRILYSWRLNVSIYPLISNANWDPVFYLYSALSLR